MAAACRSSSARTDLHAPLEDDDRTYRLSAPDGRVLLAFDANGNSVIFVQSRRTTGLALLLGSHPADGSAGESDRMRNAATSCETHYVQLRQTHMMRSTGFDQHRRMQLPHAERLKLH